MFIDVAFPISNFQVFTYTVPKQLTEIVSIGVRVRAPMGKRILSGIVVKLSDSSNFSGKMRQILEVLDETPLLDEHLWKLVKWMSEYYITPLGQAANVIPVKLSINYQLREQWVVQIIDNKRLMAHTS